MPQTASLPEVKLTYTELVKPVEVDPLTCLQVAHSVPVESLSGVSDSLELLLICTGKPASNA